MKNHLKSQERSNRMKHIWKIILPILIMISAPAQSQLRLPKLIGDGMALQANTEMRIWGWTASKSPVTVNFKNSLYRTVSNQNGEWEISIPKQKSGGPYTMTIISGDTIQIKDILIGEVWVCSGQSNMELPMRRVSPLYENEIANCENDFIRYFNVPQNYNFVEPQRDYPNGKWVKTNPENVMNFSAVSYFFAKELYDKYKTPIGLINASLGGSPAEAWLSEDALKMFPHYYEEAKKFRDSSLIKQIEASDNARMQTWYEELRSKDLGYKDSCSWRDPNMDVSQWPEMEVPGYWVDTELGTVNGIVWFRKDIELPDEASNKPAKLLMGRIVDADSVFVNGIFVGTTSYQYPPRRYEVPEGILKSGKNVIVVKVISNSGRGGFVPDKPYQLTVNNTTYNLIGKWHYKLGAVMEPLQEQTFIRWKPGGLYNAMIAPLLKYKIKGVIWYQGESNATRAIEYRKLFPALINDWRTQWNQGNFPFLFVQLPNFLEPQEQPSKSEWALLREAQLRTFLSVPNTGMAVTIDIGEWNDIHPLNKKDVGKRLALAAQSVAYGEKNVVSFGPIYKSMKVEGNKIILSFTNIGSGLEAKGGELHHFAIAGADKKFVWAKATIKGNTVIVWNDAIAHPVAIRYAWADNPQGANLYNKEGLPASPFRTDNWDE